MADPIVFKCECGKEHDLLKILLKEMADQLMKIVATIAEPGKKEPIDDPRTSAA